MRHNLTRELLVTGAQREAVGATSDTEIVLEELKVRVVALAGRVCTRAGSNDELPEGVSMTHGEHLVSEWANLGGDTITPNTVQGRLHLNRGRVAGMPHSWVVAESRLVSGTMAPQSPHAEIASFDGYDIPTDDPVSVTLGSRKHPGRMSARNAPVLVPLAADVVALLEESFPR